MENLMRELRFPEDAISFLMEEGSRMEAAYPGKLAQMAVRLNEEMPGEDEFRVWLEKVSGYAKEAGCNSYAIHMVYLLEASKILRKRYEAAGLPDELFLDTMMDLRWKLLECKGYFGVYGTCVGWWYPGFFDMTRFTFGRLQMETYAFPLDSYEENGYHLKKGDKVLNMHIPSSGPMTVEMCLDSFARARAFFGKGEDGKELAVIADTWLLDPDLMKILPEGNMKEYGKLFDVVHVKKYDSFMDGWRVFGTECDNPPEKLPRNNRLQRAVADYLAAGGKLGEGFGVFKG